MNNNLLPNISKKKNNSINQPTEEYNFIRTKKTSETVI
jgi:hypothetical protein